MQLPSLLGIFSLLAANKHESERILLQNYRQCILDDHLVEPAGRRPGDNRGREGLSKCDFVAFPLLQSERGPESVGAEKDQFGNW